MASNGLDPIGDTTMARADKAVSSEQRAHLDALDRQVEKAARLVIALGVVLLLLGFHLAKFF